MSSKARRLAEASVQAFTWEPSGVSEHPTVGASRGAVSREGLDPQARLAAVERDAFAKGYAQGERAGAESAATRTDAMLRRLAETIEELAAFRADLVRRTERQAVQLVLAIAERIVGREITLDRALLVGMARAALDRLGDRGTATIRLHPDDYAAIASKQVAEAQVRVAADPAVGRGGCVVQSDFGFMDVSPEAQFRELARALLSDADPSRGEADLSHGIVLT
jgi:flagellar assembly protein FliH